MKRSKKIQQQLEIRQMDHIRMLAQPKIGDGHRDASGYHKPGAKTGGGKRVKSGIGGY